MTNSALGFLDPGFQTPVWREQIGDTALNERIVTATDALRSLDRRFHPSQYPNGYTSYFSKLGTESQSSIMPLAERILLAGEQFLTLMGLDRSRALRLTLTDFFFNINFQHSMHKRHRHGECELSGVYYVAAPTQGAAVTFTSPLESLMMGSKIGAFHPDSAWVNIHRRHQPEAGELLLFPSWLLHEVELHTDLGERRSIGVNLVLNLETEHERTPGLLSRALPKDILQATRT